MIMLTKAIEYATAKHEGQVRKYTGEPYIEHPLAVAKMIDEYLRAMDVDPGISPTIAVLHDTVEDTDATIEEIEELFGEAVAQGVWFLTKTPNFVGDRESRKKLCEARLAKAPYSIKVIKTLDMFHNSLSIQQYDPEFWETFKVETASLLAAMGTEDVYRRAKKNYGLF